MERNCCTLSIGHAVGHDPGLPLEEVSNQLREYLFSFPYYDMIDEGKGSEVFQPHLTVVICSSEDDCHVGIEIFDKFRHRQARDVLIERGSEPDNLILSPIDGGQSPRQELWRRPRRHVLKERGRMTALLGDLLKHRFK